MSTTRRNTDEGAALVIVMAFMAVVGLIVMAVLSYSDTSFRVASSTKDIERRTAAADGGAKFALASLVANPASCAGTLAGPPSANGFTPTVSCTQRTATIFTDSTGWGIYVAASTGQLATQSAAGPNNDKRRVDGPVYNGSTGSAWNLQSSLIVANGGVLQRLGAGGCVQPSRLTVQGTGSFACTPPVDQPSPPEPTQALPSSPDVLPTRDANGDGGASCRVFEPGRYATAPVLAAQNYFKSGVYFLEAGLGDVSGKDVLAGGRTIETAVMSSLESMPCRVAETSGVQFIFGGAGFLFAHNGSRVEIHSMAKGDTTGTSIYVLSAADPAPWNTFATTRTSLGNAAVQSGQGGDASLVVHGLLYGPTSAVELEGKNTDKAQIRGGAVVGSIRMQASNSMEDPGVQITAGEPFTAQQYLITSQVTDAGGKQVTVNAVVRLPVDDPTNPIIYSWTVS